MSAFYLRLIPKDEYEAEGFFVRYAPEFADRVISGELPSREDGQLTLGELMALSDELAVHIGGPN